MEHTEAERPDGSSGGAFGQAMTLQAIARLIRNPFQAGVCGCTQCVPYVLSFQRGRFECPTCMHGAQCWCAIVAHQGSCPDCARGAQAKRGDDNTYGVCGGGHNIEKPDNVDTTRMAMPAATS